ncbi:MAG: hypothetical protein J6S96_07890 [Muribaculaceae bacterium]|nr:hypothetical protein [Muribaculaceae bacterium]
MEKDNKKKFGVLISDSAEFGREIRELIRQDEADELEKEKSEKKEKQKTEVEDTKAKGIMDLLDKMTDAEVNVVKLREVEKEQDLEFLR